MASIISGYEYDIFISYRQKDNKGDHWVTEFVNALKIELETTFKEEVSIYFDLNHQDGLQSSHHVSKSLENKLKCLILIPILSHTYCDSKSYAWNNEFCVFNRLADKDRFGKNIRIHNGNVISRILPVKIHHLDPSDLILIEEETGSLPRTIDFIYEESGVNRPLLPSDHKNENLNKTDFRNQINKLANTIGDILASMNNGKSIENFPEHCDTCIINNEPVSTKSIAVLPFTNLSKDPEQEYFGEGIAEEIINSLVHMQDLKVAGHMSSLQFKGIEVDMREVGTKLGVCNVLVGSVRIYGKKLRVTAQLISMEDGFNLWSEKYDRNMDDIFNIQDEIALAITEKLKVTLAEQERKRASRNYTQNHEAYELFLKGKFYTNKRGTYIPIGSQYFQKAIDIDHSFALAHAGLADSNSLIASYGLVAPRQVMNEIKQAAETAIKLDPTICEPYCSLGYYYTCIDRNWQKAKAYFLKSLELNPNYTQGHYWYGYNYLAWVEGNFEEAEKHGKIALELEPLSAICYAIHSRILHASGKFDEALEVCQKGLELEPNSYLCQLNEGNVYFSLKQYDKAVAAFEMALKISHRHHFALNGMIWPLAKQGHIDKAKELMDELMEKAKTEYIGYTFTAISAAYLDDLDFAFDCLEKAFDELDPVIITLKTESWFPPNLTQDERFRKMVNRIYPENILLEYRY